MLNILVVDDSEVDRRIVGGLLEKNSAYRVQFAKNGREAISFLKKTPPDLVVTDLQMPERDGLELVRAIRLHYAHIPVVLMTAHGSDALAVQALEEGAAGYVAKSQLGDRLVETVDELFSIARADHTYERLIGCLRRTVFQFSLDTDPALHEPLVDLVQQLVSGMGLCDANGRYRIGVALKAALANALFRGNLEISSAELDCAHDGTLEGPAQELVESRRRQAPYQNRRIQVDVELNEPGTRLVVRDDGPGFAWSAWLNQPPAESLESGSGRGLVLIRAFVDELQFNESGNEIRMFVARQAT